LPLRLEESYLHCERIARAKAKNFYYSFLVLPKPKRLAMCAVYAFMRECDDLSDESGATTQRLDAWREDLHRSLDGSMADHALWPAFADTVHRYNIPRVYLEDMIDGVSSDLSFTQPRNFEELYRYCYRVASVVGLTITHIFGFRDARALEMAEKCGIAFQLTNIIRDVKEDIGNQRIYLPADWMERYGVTEAHLRAGATSPALHDLLAELGARARQYFEFSRPLIGMVQPDSQGSLWALIEIYDRLLKKIVAADYHVLETRHALSLAEKLGILLRALFR
jgi:phytoene synthase